MTPADKAKKAKVPQPAEVLAAVHQDLEDLSGPVDRLEIRQATPYQYTYRCYRDASDEYEGGVIEFDR